MSRNFTLLDLYCGAGGAAWGYFTAGFANIVGVDINPQPNYPFDFVQADAVEYALEHGKAFDAIHASPPCQVHSVTAAMVRGRGLEVRFSDMVPATRGALEILDKPYIIENVVGADLINPVILCGEMFGLDVIRHRAFESNFPLVGLPHLPHKVGGTNSHKGLSARKHGAVYICVAGNNYFLHEGKEAMGIDWMESKSELSEAIPPAYTEYLGRQLIEKCRRG